MTGAFTHGQDPRDMGGLTIQEYSKTQKIPEPEAWRQLRRGEQLHRLSPGHSRDPAAAGTRARFLDLRHARAAVTGARRDAGAAVDAVSGTDRRCVR